MKILLIVVFISLYIWACFGLIHCPDSDECDIRKCPVPECVTRTILTKRHPCDCCESCYYPKGEGEDCSLPSTACINELLCIRDKCKLVYYKK